MKKLVSGQNVSGSQNGQRFPYGYPGTRVRLFRPFPSFFHFFQNRTRETRLYSKNSGVASERVRLRARADK